MLKHGRDSRFGRFFDIDWSAGGGKVLLPVVGDDDQPDAAGPIGNLHLSDGMLGYHDHRFPISPGTAGDTDDPQVVHARQHYRLVSWRTADEDMDYRRFFAVNTLAGVRVEDRDVFEASHVEIARWFRERLVDGLRVDHPDGLRHPAAYLDDLAESHRGRLGRGGEDPGARRGPAGAVEHRRHHRLRGARDHRPGARRPRRRVRARRPRRAAARRRTTLGRAWSAPTSGTSRTPSSVRRYDASPARSPPSPEVVPDPAWRAEVDQVLVEPAGRVPGLPLLPARRP
ncbi:hypothetical protein [Nocardioides convexus]|uniref:hypothetical protein n=1 Tax=Nocardioides convexus TaxID=2712224 RepID=UPI0024185A94|nr:hypothetical protein [Nocardioides convexus]